jgi:SAM-dependent methyltransferase
MNEDEKRRILATYSERLREHGYSPTTIGWPKRRHRLRYFILTSHWPLGGAEILDFGCGFGDLYAYCRERGIDVAYEGVDINPDLIAEGRRQHPEANLAVRDALVDGLPRDYDYVFSSGVHNFKLADSWSFITATFELFHHHARRGFAINFLSDKVGYPLAHAHHADPCRILELAYRYSNRITLRNDYMPFEFTVFVDKDERFDPEVAVYDDFRVHLP